MKVTLELDIPDNLKFSEYDLKMHLGVKLYEDGLIGTGSAAHIIGMERADFIRKMGKYGGNIFQTTPEEFEQDFLNARQAIRKNYNL